MSGVGDLCGLNPERAAWAEASSSSDLQPARLYMTPLCFWCQETGKNVQATSSCRKCSQYFCDECWTCPPPHLLEIRGHEQIRIGGSSSDANVFLRLRQVFDKATLTANGEIPQIQNDGQHSRHHQVLDTLWLAVTSSDDAAGGTFSFDERPRFGDLMAEHQRNVHVNETCYPRLISFVGNTGAGKSSLIQVLMGHLWDPNITDQDVQDILTPVTGNSTDSVPTSSDIHLYQSSIDAMNNPGSPLLFADCEGFEAANHSAAAKSRDESMRAMEAKAPNHIKEDPAELKAWTKKSWNTVMRNMKRPLAWFSRSADRNQAIEELFPRLVYNTSDVVVYVVTETNLKSMGKVLEKLVTWSQKAEKSAINKASLPSLVIVINQCDPTKTQKWSSDDTTNQILAENANLMNGNGVIENRKEELAKVGLPHESIKDILDGSFRAVKFLRLPNSNGITQLRTQFETLHAILNSLTEKVHNSRREKNLLLSSEQLHQFYRLTFDHFSKSTSPFDFMDAFFTVNPSPPTLQGNFSALLRATLVAAKQAETSSHQNLTDKLLAAVPTMCSAIAMDSNRRQFPGKLVHIFFGDMSQFPSDNLKVRDSSYGNSIKQALEEFVGSVFPCGYQVNLSSGKKGPMCITGKKAHTNNRHQDAAGNILGPGDFDPSFAVRFQSQWNNFVRSELNRLDGLNTTSRKDLWDAHRENIRHLHDHVPGVDLRSLPCCVWCMLNFATERLPCGHWICPSCVVGMGTRAADDERVFIVNVCDQHREGGKSLDPHFEFLDLPKTIGRRLLSLDEGGVRGILQLQLLTAIQDQLGKDIPVQDCFDMIGGTGIGGVNALGLGIRKWDVSEAIAKLTQLAPAAFKKPYHWLLTFYYSWILQVDYSLDFLKLSIKDAFGQDSSQPTAASLSRVTKIGSGPIRVFVTTNKSPRVPVLLTNYRRQTADNNQDPAEDNKKQSQKDQDRPKCAETFSISEAATATACYRRFFGTCNLSDHNQYIGGATSMACPAHIAALEAQSLWPHMPSGRPDLLVSVGCGHQKEPTAASTNPRDCADSEAMWNKSFKEISQLKQERYIRLCPEFLTKPMLPNADDVSALDNRSFLTHVPTLLTDSGENLSGQDDLRGKVDRVVRRLISTIFYFEKASSKLCKEGDWIVYGHIRCRFKETSNITKAFGQRISGFKSPRFVSGSDSKPLWEFNDDALNVMKGQGRFHTPRFEVGALSEDMVNIKFIADGFPAENISGSLEE